MTPEEQAVSIVGCITDCTCGELCAECRSHIPSVLEHLDAVRAEAEADAVADENSRICGLIVERVEQCGCMKRSEDGTPCRDCEVCGELLNDIQQALVDAREKTESEDG